MTAIVVTQKVQPNYGCCVLDFQSVKLFAFFVTLRRFAARQSAVVKLSSLQSRYRY